MNFTNEELVMIIKSSMPNKHKYEVELYNRVEKLLKKMVYKRLESNQITISYDDLMAQANLGFAKALKIFDNYKFLCFTTLLTKVASNEIARLYVDSNRQKRTCNFEIVPIHSTLSLEDSTITVEETISSEYGFGYSMSDKHSFENDENELYEELSKRLTRFQLETLKLLNQGLTQPEIGTKLNKTRQNINASIKHIRKVAVECGYNY